MRLTPHDQLKAWTAVMLLIAAGLSIYFTVYVWRRVDRPQLRDGRTLVNNSSEDWAYYYAASIAMGTGEDIYKVKAPGRDRAGCIYPPMLAFLYQPLARMGFIAGARASMVIDLLAMAAALALATRALLERMAGRARWQMVLTAAVLAAVLSVDKIKGEFQMLQCNGLVALGMAMGLWLLDRKPVWAGLALGFAINIKYQALGLLFYLVFRKRWKTLAGTVGGTAFWAFLPAVSVGFAKDSEYLVRGFAGVLRLVGFQTGDTVANIEPLSTGYSTSITSAAARLVESTRLAVNPFVIAGAVALLWLLAIALMYRQHKVPLLAWPTSLGQRLLPWSVVAGVEWIMVIGFVLAFSPQTNSRHLVQTALINVLGVVLVLESRNKERWMATGGLLIMWMSLNLPPGSRVGNSETSSVESWHRIGGPTWGVLISVAMLAWVGLTLAQRDHLWADVTANKSPGHLEMG